MIARAVAARFRLDLRRNGRCRIVAGLAQSPRNLKMSQQTAPERELAELLVESLNLEGVDPHAIGRQWLAKTLRMVERGMADRARIGEGSFLDVHYHDLLADPWKQVRRICEFADAPLPPGRSPRGWPHTPRYPDRVRQAVRQTSCGS